VSTPGGSGSSFVIVSAKQLVDRCRACLHLLSGWREARAWGPMADEPSLLGRRPVAGQRVAYGRVAPPSGRCGRYRIDSCVYATPDPVHHASRLRRTRLPHGLPITAKMRTGTGDRLSRPPSAPGTRRTSTPKHGAGRITKCDRLPPVVAECQARVDLRPVVSGRARRSGASVV
jgi:hypothetical protein